MPNKPTARSPGHQSDRHRREMTLEDFALFRDNYSQLSTEVSSLMDDMKKRKLATLPALYVPGAAQGIDEAIKMIQDAQTKLLHPRTESFINRLSFMQNTKKKDES